MKKKFTLEITNPCSENFDKMTPSGEGSFCSSCAKNVIDLSRKTNSEIAKFISESKNANICARVKASQLKEEFEFNEVSKLTNFKYAAVAASILLVSNVSGQEKTPVKTEITSSDADLIVGKIAYNHNVNEEISIIVKGKLLESKSRMPFNKKDYPNLNLTINGNISVVEFNSKTGEFIIPVQILKNSKNLQVTITTDDYYLSKTISFKVGNLDGNILNQNIFIDEGELAKTQVMILGGLGINYFDDKKSNKG